MHSPHLFSKPVNTFALQTLGIPCLGNQGLFSHLRAVAVSCPASPRPGELSPGKCRAIETTSLRSTRRVFPECRALALPTVLTFAVLLLRDKRT